jgi:acetate kinase
MGVTLLLRRVADNLIKFGEVDIMLAGVDALVFQTGSIGLSVRTIKRQKVESIRTLQIANASQKTR